MNTPTQSTSSEPVKDSKPSDRSTILDLAKEAIGYENGLWRTLVDLRRKPREVLDSYLIGEKRYVSPFKLLTTSLSLWILINSFLIDWYVIWRSYATAMIDAEKELMIFITHPDPAKLAKMNALYASTLKTDFVMLAGQVAGDIFAKLYVPFMILLVVGGSYLSTRWSRKSDIGLRKMISVISYSMASNIPLFLIFTTSFAINVWLGFVLVLINAIVIFSGRADLVAFSPMRNYFEIDGKSIEKRIIRANFIVALVLQFLLAVGYVLYFKAVDRI